MNTELNILKQISENKGKAPVQRIAKELEMRNDYIRYLCIELIKKGLAKKLKRRDWYEITRKGQKEIGKIEKSIKKSPSKKHIPSKRRSRKKIKKKKKIRKEFKKKTHRKSKHKPKKKAKEEPKKRTRGVARRMDIKKVRMKAKKRPYPEASEEVEIRADSAVIPSKSRKEILQDNKINKIIKVLKNLFRLKKD